MARVTATLPVYNSITKTEKDDLLPQMITSILNQTHKDWELLILDNQSTDNTIAVCKKVVGNDKRVKILRDDKRRSAEEAHQKLSKIATGDFICCLSDDDLLNHSYFELLLNKANENDQADLIYSNGAAIDLHNKATRSLIANEDGVYNLKQSYYESFHKAVHKRIVLPTLFGLCKKDVFTTLMPNKPFDELRANMDNLFMAKFFLNKYKALFVNYNLFYYRDRNRHLEPDDLDYMPKNPFLIWVYYIRHQLYFYNAVCKIIEGTNHGDDTKGLKVTTLDSCFNQFVKLLNWVGRDMLHDKFEQSVFKEICDQFKPIFDLRLTVFTNNQEIVAKQMDTMRLRSKILQERVLKYISNVVQDTDLVENTQKVVGDIKNDVINSI